MSLLAAPLGLRRRTVSAGAASDPIGDFNAVAHTTFDLAAEGFSDTSAIATLTDQTGNGHDATQATGAEQPTAQTVSGVKVARFDGSDDVLLTGTFTQIQNPNTIIMLVKSDDADTSERFLCDGASFGSARHAIKTTGTWQFQAQNAVSSGVTDDSDWHVFVAVFRGTADSRLHLDGQEIAMGDEGIASLTRLAVGSNTAGTRVFDGDIAFVGLYDGDLEVDDLDLLNAVGAELAQRVSGGWTDITPT